MGSSINDDTQFQTILDLPHIIVTITKDLVTKSLTPSPPKTVTSFMEDP